ncbi:MAG: hypothetical protein Kow0010_03440 [Dehalococcoidia bacterium]
MAAERDPALKLGWTREQKTEVVRRVQHHLREAFDLDLGDLGAELLVEFFGELVGPFYYNQAIEEAAKLVNRQAETMLADLGVLMRPVPEPRGDGRRG